MEKEADLKVAGSEIIEQLPSIGFVELVTCFDLDYDSVVNHQIEALDAKQFPFINDPDSKLSFDVMPTLPQLTLQCQDVQTLEKPEPERVVNLKKCPDDRPGERFFEQPLRLHPTIKQHHRKTGHRIDAPDDPTYATTDPPLSGVIPEIRVP